MESCIHCILQLVRPLSRHKWLGALLVLCDQDGIQEFINRLLSNILSGFANPQEKTYLPSPLPSQKFLALEQSSQWSSRVQPVALDPLDTTVIIRLPYLLQVCLMLTNIRCLVFNNPLPSNNYPLVCSLVLTVTIARYYNRKLSLTDNVIPKG